MPLYESFSVFLIFQLSHYLRSIPFIKNGYIGLIKLHQPVYDFLETLDSNVGSTTSVLSSKFASLHVPSDGATAERAHCNKWTKQRRDDLCVALLSAIVFFDKPPAVKLRIPERNANTAGPPFFIVTYA